ncbi:hypothetical protein [Streptomyces sparsus]
MADRLSENDVHEAMARHTGRSALDPQLRLACHDSSTVDLLELRVVRCLRTDTERKRSRPGRFDLSHRDTYEGPLHSHPVEPPKDPGRAQQAS